MRSLLKAIGITLLAASYISAALAQSATAETAGFTVDANKLPISATTTFFTPSWTAVDQVNTAQHELLHAIGFSRTYANFLAKIDTSNAFRPAPAARILAKLTAASSGTHIDPAGGTVDGFDQALSVMVPVVTRGNRMRGQDKNVLDAGFAWVGKDINIKVVYATPFSAADKRIIEDAVTAAKALLGSNGTGKVFTWTVRSAAGLATATGALTATGVDGPAAIAAKLAGRDQGRRGDVVVAALSRPNGIVAALRDAGAKPMTGLEPPPIDVVYSIVSGERSGLYRTTSFGVHLTRPLSIADLEKLGKLAGFHLASGNAPGRASPNIYVNVDAGRDLWDVLGNTLSLAEVATVNLDYIEY